MNNRLPWDITATDADDGKAAAAAAAQVVRRLIVVLLLTATALDLTRCGLVMTAPRHPAPAAGLVAAGLAAAALTARTARGCRAGQRWAGWAALLIGAASAPQAAASGFRSPYTIPDTATAALGMLLAITILATAGRMHRRDTTPKIPACWTREPSGDPARGRQDCPAQSIANRWQHGPYRAVLTSMSSSAGWAVAHDGVGRDLDLAHRAHPPVSGFFILAAADISSRRAATERTPR